MHAKIYNRIVAGVGRGVNELILVLLILKGIHFNSNKMHKYYLRCAKFDWKYMSVTFAWFLATSILTSSPCAVIIVKV